MEAFLKKLIIAILGLLPGGKREVLSVVHHPEEGALCWEMELEALKDRGVESVDVIISDGLSGIEKCLLKGISWCSASTLYSAFQAKCTGVSSKEGSETAPS